MPPCTQASHVAGLYRGLQLVVPSLRRELQTAQACTETCQYAADGWCDDGGPGAEYFDLDGALMLFRLALLVFAVCSEQEQSGLNKCIALWARRNRSYRNEWRVAIWARRSRSYRNNWFKLALLALLVPRVSATTTTPPDGDGAGGHKAESGVQILPLTPLCADDVDSGAFHSGGAPMPCSYFSAQPSACASYSIARTNCPVACDTCSPLLPRISHTRPPPSPPPLKATPTSSLYPPSAGGTQPRSSSLPSSPPLLLLPLPPPSPLRSPLPPWSPLMLMLVPCSVLPCTEASNILGLYRGLQLTVPSHLQHMVPSHHRELQTQVSTSEGLRSALANTGVGHIVLAPGTYYLTAELSVTRSVVLEAAVAGSVVLDAQAGSSSPRRVLEIDPGSLGVVQLIGLNMTGGYKNHGGGVFVQSGTVSIVNSQVYSNEATIYGGGVYVQDGTVAISSCTISGNTAPSFKQCGGGVYVSSGTVTITSSSIYGNTAYYGGGVFVQGGTMAISSCTISGNTAGSYGGGVYDSHVSPGTVTIASSLITGNTAGGAGGGGVFVDTGVDGIVTLSSCTISGNIANDGGGGVAVYRGGTVAISSCTISGNSARDGGGVAVYGGYGGNVKIMSSSISGNSASRGPSVYVDSCCGATVCSWATALTGVNGTVSTCQAPPPPSPPSPPSPDKAMDIGPVAGGVGGVLLLLAGLCGLTWKLRRLKATPKTSGFELPQGQGVVSPVRLLELD